MKVGSIIQHRSQNGVRYSFFEAKLRTLKSYIGLNFGDLEKIAEVQDSNRRTWENAVFTRLPRTPNP